MSDDSWSGGCQCGAVRYAFSVRPDNACLCHCRMCQKQVGNFFGAYAGSHTDNFRVTRGQIARFHSSADAVRGFCRDCGTPLAYYFLSHPRVDVTIGSLDRCAEFKPIRHIGAEGMASWWGEVADLPAMATGVVDTYCDTDERFEMIRASNRQHPDHDTDHWPPM